MTIITSSRLNIIPIQKINAFLPQIGIIYEIGSGHGVLAANLAKKFPRRKVVGLDIEESRIKKSKRNFSLKNLEFEKADAIDYSYPTMSGSVLSDFLHHVSYIDQLILLKKLYKKLEKDGVLIIKEIDKNDGVRMWCSRLWDFVLYPQDKIYYRTQSSWIKILKNIGFSVKVSREVIWFPGSTILYICTKK